MSQSNRGAAQVSLMWVIALTVIALVAVLFGFLQNGEFTRVSDELAAAKLDLATEKQTSQDLRTEKRDNSAAIGWTGTGEFTNPAVVTAARDELIREFSVDGANLRAFSDAIGPVIAKFRQISSERDSALAESGRLRADLAARESATRSTLAEKERTLADARREKDEVQANLQRQVADLERVRDSLRVEYRGLESQLAELRTLADQRERDLRGEIAKFQQRNSILADQLNSVSRRAAAPDGAVLTAAGDLGIVWIDRGHQDRITPGMEFEVRNATTQTVKGRIRVQRTEDRRSEARILAQSDKYDPIRTDDLVFNAVYDPTRTPVAALLGNGFGRYDADDLRAMLKDVGVEVRDGVTDETDILLLGTPFFDEETGDMIVWESMDAYKSAQALAVEVITMRDWTQWLGK
jgi:hypothetical protein